MILKDFIEIINNQYDVNPIFFDQIEIYKNFLQSQNKLYNLTRLDDDEIIYEKYFYESIEPFFKVNLKNKKILDIGSGSGIPGIVLKLLEPSIELTIIESNIKRVNFLNQLIKKLNLEKVYILYQRAETNWKDWQNHFDIVTSRAVSNLGSTLEISCQYTKIGGLIIEPKSHNYENEYKKVINKLDDYGLILSSINTYKYSSVLIFEKIKNANEAYPREWKDIIKEYK